MHPSPTASISFIGTTLRLDWPSSHVALVTFIREKEHNSISMDMISELRKALLIVTSERPAAMVLTGTGSSFCAGADLKLLSSIEDGLFYNPILLRDKFLAPLAKLFDDFEEAPFPVIAAINGHALGGGCEMALSADLRIMSKHASLGLPEVLLGATPGAGGVQKLIRHVGRSKALEWILLGSKISAITAEQAGLLVEVTEPDTLLSRALELASRFVKVGPKALAQAKASIYLSEDADLRTARRFGLEALTSLAGSDEWREGVLAFIEKREPRFR